MANTLDIRLRVLDANTVRSAILSVGAASVQAGKMAKDASAEARKTADAAKDAAQKAAAAVVSGSKEERAARKQAAAEAKSAYLQAEQAAKQAARVSSQASRDTLAVLMQTSRAVVRADKDVAASGIAAAKARAQADKDAANVAKQAAQQSAAAQKQAYQAAQSPMQRRLSALNGQLATSDRYSNINQTLDATRGIALGLSGAAAVGGAAIGKSAMDADEMARTRKGLSFSLGGDTAADEAIDRLKTLDRNSPFDFRETANILKNLLGKGFSVDEAFKQINLVGDAIARLGGTTDNLTSAFVQLGQIKSTNKATQQDIRPLGESGGLPITNILKEGLSPQRYKAMNEGELLNADEFFAAFNKGLERFSGGMAAANDSLSGQLSNLQSAFYQLSASLGKELLPTITQTVKLFTGVVDAFNAWPEPLKKLAAWAGVAGVGVVGLAGLGAGLLVTAGKAAIGLSALKDVIDQLGNSAAQNAVKTAVSAPANAATGAATGAAAGGATAGGVTLGGIGSAVGGLTVGAGIVLGGLGYEALRFGSRATGIGGFGNMPSILQIAGTYSGLTDSPTDQARKEYIRTHGQSAPSTVSKIAPTVAAAAATSPISAMGSGVAPIPFGGASSGPIDEQQALIYGLQDQIRHAKGKANAGLRDSLRDRLTSVQRALKSSRAAAVLARKEDRAALAAERVANRDELSLSKAENNSDASSQIAALQEQLLNAKEAHDSAAVGRLVYEIEKEKAEKRYQDEMAAAAQAGARRSALEAIAEINYQSGQSLALAKGHKAELGEEDRGTKKGDRDAAIRRALAQFQGGTQIGGGLSYYRGFTTQNPGGNFAPLNPAGASSRETGRTTTQNADGSYKTTLTVEVSTPANNLAALQGMY